jgi:hypothetical protein
LSVQTVTSENLAEFVSHRMSLSEPAKEPEKAPEKVEDKPQETKLEDVLPDDDVVEDGKTPEKPAEDKPKKGKLAERFSELTGKARQAEERAQAAERRAEEAERKVKEAESKANPKPAEKVDDEVGPEPRASDYTDAFEYAKDLSKWSTDKAMKERDEREATKAKDQEREKVVGEWAKRVEATKVDFPDYDAMLASSEVGVSDAVKDALIESELGPRILYEFASNPEVVEKLNKMKIMDQLKEIGKLEIRLAKEEKTATKDEPEAKPEPVVKKAPAPITPARGTKVPENVVNEPGEFKGTYSEWKALRQRR